MKSCWEEEIITETKKWNSKNSIKMINRIMLFRKIKMS